MEICHRFRQNIPQAIRATLNARFEKKELINDAVNKVSDLYDMSSTDEMKTREGVWKIYMQSDYIPPSINAYKQQSGEDRFCAVYYRKGKALIIIRWNIIEQVPFFSYPKNSLTEENGLEINLHKTYMMINTKYWLYLVGINEKTTI